MGETTRIMGLPPKRRALVLSGGAAKGSAQAGMILRMTEAGITHDAYFGTSVGAINGANMAMWHPGWELEGARSLVRRWHTEVTTEQVYRHHNWLLRWLLVPWKTSIYSGAPLRKYLAANLRPYHKHLAVGLTNLSSGEHEFVANPTAADIYSSAAFPLGFDPGRLANGDWTSDGGLVHVTPLAAAIAWGADIIDVITLDAPGVPRWSNPPTKWWELKFHKVGMRMLNVMVQNIIERDLVVCQAHNTRIAAGRGDPGKRWVELNVYRPPTPLPIDSLDFSTETNKRGTAIGYDLMGTLLAG